MLITKKSEERLLTTLVLTGEYAVIRNVDEPHTVFSCAENPDELFTLAKQLIQGWNSSAEVIPVRAKLNLDCRTSVTYQLVDFGLAAKLSGYSLEKYLSLREKVDYFFADFRQVGRLMPIILQSFWGRQKIAKPTCSGTRTGLLMNAETLAGAGDLKGSPFWRDIFHQDMVETIVRLPKSIEYKNQYAVIITHNKTPERKGLVQFIDAQAMAPDVSGLSDKQIWEVATLWHAQANEGFSQMLPINQVFS